VVALVSFNVFTPSVTLAVVFALVLLVADVILFRLVSAVFDRERLITGARAQGASWARGHGASPGAVRKIPRIGGTDGGRRDT
jgi:Na+/glutamate symporter